MMAHICRNMVGCFLGQNGRFDDGEELFDDYNLQSGIIYAEDLLGVGYTECPVQGFDLKSFKDWCKKQLRPK